MYAYVFIKNKNKYLTIKDSDIKNFSYDTIGRQSKSFAKKPFKCLINKGKSNEIREICQILIIGESVEEIEELVQERRLHVPKLSESDVPVSSDTNTAEDEKIKANEYRKKIAKKKKAAANETCSQIIQAHENVQVLQPQQSDLPRIPSFKINAQRNYLHESNPTEDVDENIGNTQRLDDDALHNCSPIDDLPEEQWTQNNTLQKQLKEEKDRTRTLAKANRLLQDKCIALKEKLDSAANTSTEPEHAVVKTYPEPINTRSGVQVRRNALDEAYSKDEPSTFYINMCYSVWGYQDLAKRCVKKTKKTCAEYKVLTPKKRRVAKAHLAHFLQFYKYPDSLQQKYFRKINAYAHRAIVHARSHMKLIEKYPELDDSTNEDIEMINI